jgi:hypothetical protein
MMSKQNTIEWLEKVLKSGLTYEQEQLFQSAFEQAKEMEMQKSTIQGYNRKAVFAELTEFDYLAKPNDYIEVCEWHNGEGFDVEVSGNVMPDSRFQLTWGQYKAMKALIKELEGNNED